MTPVYPYPVCVALERAQDESRVIAEDAYDRTYARFWCWLDWRTP